MKRLLSDAEMERVSAYIAAQMGLHFPPAKWSSLEQSFTTAARELGFADPRECIAWFMSAPPSRELFESMAGYLTIGETYFLREIRCFEILEEEILPEIIRKRRGKEERLRIWSVGCATGEEPYSIAILLDKMRDLLRGWEISILATDINPQALRKAREGLYTNWSFRNTPAGFKENYFRETGDGRFELLPRIRKMVQFSCLNLVEDCYPSLITDTNAMDVIFCRNVLMYLTPELAGKVVARFHLCLLNGGWLMVSPCEASNLFLSRFEPVNFPDAILYRKGSGRKGAKPGKVELEIAPPPPFFLPAFPSSPKPEIHPVPPPCRESREEIPPYVAALQLYEQGAYGEAAARVAAQLALDKNDTQALALLCRIYANEGRLADALNVSDQALAADKLSAGLHYLRAVILQEQGMDDAAVASLKKALYLDQDLVLAHFTLANFELRRGKGRESQRSFANALSLLERYRPDEVLPESDGMSAGRLKEIIRTTTISL